MRKKITVLFFILAAVVITSNAQSLRSVAAFENFDNMTLPNGWTIVDSLNDSHTWQFVSVYPVAYTLDGTPFAIVNSDAAGSINMSEQLITSEYNLSSNNSIIIEFDQYFHYFGGGGNEKGRVDVWNGSAWVNIYTVSEEKGAWGSPNHVSIDASAYKNANFKVRFYYKDANNDYWWAIDNVKIWDPQPNDVGVLALNSPSSGFGMGNEQISIKVKNFGTLSQTSIPVSYQVNGGAIVNEVLNNNYASFTALDSGESFNYVFNATFDFSGYQSYNIKVWTRLTTDTDNENDTLLTTITNAPQLFQDTLENILSGTLGIESDGEYYWVSFFTTPGKFGKYSFSGELLDTFRISSINVGIRDLAYDPVSDHFFGGSGSPTIYEIDLKSATPNLIGTKSAPTSVRYIAYDHVRNGFWIGNINGDIYLVDKNGSQINSSEIVNPILNANLAGMNNRTGLAFDDWSCPSEYLWVFSQPSTPSNVYLSQIDIHTGLPTGRNFDITGQITLTGAAPTAGGLFTQPDIVNGTVSLGGIVMGATNGVNPNLIFILNLQALHPDQPMVINSVFPAENATMVHLDHLVMMMIDEPYAIKNSSLIQITDGTNNIAIDSVRAYGDTIKIFHATFMGETNYTVKVLPGALSGLCSDNTYFEWSFTTGVAGVGEVSGAQIKMYPNPANNGFVIENARGAIIKIRSITGSCIMEINIDNDSRWINTSELSEGIYLVEILKDNTYFVQKLLINR